MSAIHSIPRARLAVAVGCLLVVPSGQVAAGVLIGQSRTVAPGETPETWQLSQNARLTLSPGSSSDWIDALQSSVTLNGGAVTTTATGKAALALRNGSAAIIGNGSSVTSTAGIGLSVTARQGDPGSGESSTVQIDGSSVTGSTAGAFLNANVGFVSTGSAFRATNDDGVGISMASGNVALNARSTVSGQLHGIRIFRDDRGWDGAPTFRNLTIDNSTVSGIAGSGIFIERVLPAQPVDATILIGNGSTVSGGNGFAIDMATGTSANVTVDGSQLEGGVRVANGASASLILGNASVMTGSTTGNIAATIGSASLWNLTGNSNVASLALNDGGAISFQASADGMHRNLAVAGPFSGTGGTITLNTELNSGGALTNQFTDRLLIQGDVTTTGPTEIVVVPTGAGAGTDRNQNGAVDAHEGISLVQVGGSSRDDAFVLRDGYVAVGAYQYTLHAFGPGQADQAQNLLPSGNLNWDYRLGNTIVCKDDDCDDDGEDPGPGPDPGDPDPGPGPGPEPEPEPETGREAVVPQVPSYLSAPAALLTYGDMMNDGLRQRLGDIRSGTTHDPVGGEVFARYLGGQMRYNSNRSFGDYGYDFNQQVNALQFGGGVVALDGDNGTLRAGWAADHGTTRVTPKAVDGHSSAKYNANGVSAWVTWQHGDGLWIDGVVGATRFHGDVGTDLRGADVGRIRAHGWTMSVEAGKPFVLANEWTVEPRFQLKHQSLNFRDFRDADGLDVRLGTAKQTSATAGVRVSRAANPLFMPYAGVDLTHTSNGDPSVDVSSEAWDVADRFRSGRVGNSYRVSAGAVSQLGERVQVYGEANYRRAAGSYGMRGFAGNLGIRVTF